jgi:hypothetical protein
MGSTRKKKTKLWFWSRKVCFVSFCWLRKMTACIMPIAMTYRETEGTGKEGI